MRTFSQTDWTSALAQWKAGNFSAEWKPYRHQAAMRGMIYPPEGSKHDSWEDDSPSQRAMLIRAIRESPKLTAEAISRSRTWGEAITFILSRRDDWRSDIDQRDREIAAQRRDERPTHYQAMQSVAAILERIDQAR